MDIIEIITSELNVKKWQVEAAVKLIDEGNTIPFIARYRKPVTGELNDEQLRLLNDRLTYLRNLEEKKQTVIESIESQGKMTPELLQKINEASTIVAVDDLYRPYRPKRRTRATDAKEKGLEPLANIILLQLTANSIEKEAENYVTEENGLDVKSAIAGALDIIAENVSENAEYRKAIRNIAMKQGMLVSKAKKADDESVYENYYDFTEAVDKIPGHRILAINRGEKEKVLNVKVELPDDIIVSCLEKAIITPNSTTASYLKEAISDSYKRLILPAVEREVRNILTDRAQEGAMRIFGDNLKQLLMQPPISGKNVLGWDPAFRTGCKLAVVDATGKVLDTVVIYPTAPQFKVEEAKATLKKLIDKYDISLISLGNGTASRESEAVIVDLIKELDRDVKYIIVSEAGASVYSASKLATEEFPNFDVGQRSAASIARRLQDPLAELVKIDPKAIGVGQYQHDMNQTRLGEVLGNTVEDCVNNVGVDLNTASVSLLEYISGISKTIAKNIVDYWEENGRFNSRKELLKVPKLGPKAFEQCAGFLRITGGSEPLDATSVHPESYDIAKKIISLKNLSINDINTGGLKGISKGILDNSDELEKYAKTTDTDVITLRDIIKELEKPARDPRDEMPKPVLKSDILEMKDLKEGMILKGTVRNVIDFGAFVDIGVHEDGLVHISQLSDKYVKHPLDVVSIGDIVEVKVLGVDTKKKRISLTMKF